MTISHAFVRFAPHSRPARQWAQVLENAFTHALPAAMGLALLGGSAIIIHALATVTAFS